MVRILNPGICEHFLKNARHRRSGPPSLLCNVTGVPSRGKAARAWIWRWPPSKAEVKNEWSYTSTPPIYLRGIDRCNFTSYLYVRSPSNSWSLRQMSVSSVIDFCARITKMHHMNGTTRRGREREREREREKSRAWELRHHFCVLLMALTSLVAKLALLPTKAG